MTAITVEDIERLKVEKLDQPKDLVRIQKADGKKESKSKATLSTQTVKHLLRLLRQILDYAVDLGYLRINQAKKVNYPKVLYPEMDFFKPPEIRVLLKHTPTKWIPLFLVAISTGLRIGEILAMRWNNLDEKDRQYFVKETWQRPRNGRKAYFSDPKTRSSIAPVDLMSEAMEAVVQHRKRQAEEKLKAGKDYKDQGLIFATAEGGPLDSANVVRVYKKAMDVAELPTIGRKATRWRLFFKYRIR